MLSVSSSTPISDKIWMTQRDEFFLIYSTLSDIKHEIFKNKRRKKKSAFLSFLSFYIEGIYESINYIFNGRCSEDSLNHLFSNSLRLLNILIREMRAREYNEYLDIFQKMYYLIVEFLGDSCLVQLELFLVQDYHQDYPRHSFQCFRNWYLSRCVCGVFPNKVIKCTLSFIQFTIDFSKTGFDSQTMPVF